MFDNNNQFYPTPTNLINKMLDKVDFNKTKTILEPSAGSGNIVEVVKERIKSNRGYYNRNIDYDIDTIEIDKNLQHILKGKDFRVVHDDFLTYNTFKRYNLIIMNPPFLNGDKHLLKAIKMQKKGGQIVCILNAETLLNPYSNTRKDLIRKLEEYNAEIEYIQNAFTDADRQTDVEIALITIDIPKPDYNSTIISKLRQEEQYEQKEYNSDYMVNSDFIKGIVERYNFEVKAGLKLIAEYESMQPLLLNSFKNDAYSSPILELKLHYADVYNNTLENGYIRQIRYKYWNTLFGSKEFMGLFTSNLKEKYRDRVDELRDYDFSLYNIYNIRIELNKEMLQGVEDTIIDLFEELSHKYSYMDESSQNIHYYNGWKTNKSYKINKRVILRLNGFDNYSKTPYYKYNVREKLADIEKVFNYLDGGITEDINLFEVLERAELAGQTKKINTKYFLITFFKKGSCHLEFKNLDLLKKFNLYGSRMKGWLPPTYGKHTYKDMTTEEKNVIDEFEGKQSYEKVMNNKDYYITETSNLLMLTS